MRETICDLCHFEGRTTLATRKGQLKTKTTKFSIDVCEDCFPRLPKDRREFLRLAFRVENIALTEAEIDKLL